MPFHFFVPELIDTNLVELEGDRAHYLGRVMRVRAGEELACFDGQGGRYLVTVDSVDAKHVVLTSAGRTAQDTAPDIANHLCLSLLKGQAMDRAVQSAVELGAATITLTNSERTNVKLDARRAENKLAHWRKIVIGACEQSGRAHIPKLSLTNNLQELLADRGPDISLIVCEESGSSSLPLEHAERVFLIGPEGGYSQTELAQLEQLGTKKVSLGATTLRAETVPAVLLGLVNYLDAQNRS